MSEWRQDDLWSSGEELKARARREDPQPSHEAASKVNAKLNMTERRQDVLACVAEIEPCYDEQIVSYYREHWRERRWLSQSDSGLRTRRDELVTMGTIVKAGETKNHRGYTVTLWQTNRGAF